MGVRAAKFRCAYSHWLSRCLRTVWGQFSTRRGDHKSLTHRACTTFLKISALADWEKSGPWSAYSFSFIVRRSLATLSKMCFLEHAVLIERHYFLHRVSLLHLKVTLWWSNTRGRWSNTHIRFRLKLFFFENWPIRIILRLLIWARLAFSITRTQDCWVFDNLIIVINRPYNCFFLAYVSILYCGFSRMLYFTCNMRVRLWLIVNTEYVFGCLFVTVVMIHGALRVTTACVWLWVHILLFIIWIDLFTQ